MAEDKNGMEISRSIMMNPRSEKLDKDNDNRITNRSLEKKVPVNFRKLFLLSHNMVLATSHFESVFDMKSYQSTFTSSVTFSLPNT